MLKPQDILVLLKLVVRSGDWSYGGLAKELHMSSSEVFKCIERATASNLFDAQSRKPRISALEEFLVHGIKYVFPAHRGTITRGIPTAFAAPPLSDLMPQQLQFKPVWPDAEGSERGYELEPLYPSVPKAAKQDPALYEMLTLVDAIREGRAREQQLAITELKARLRKVR